MLKNLLMGLFCIGITIIPQYTCAQIEEESAEISLEENNDAFQESFYEALKQKGIENYDKAIEHLLICKKIDSSNVTIDFELGKNYLAKKDYIKAEDHLFSAVKKEPDNIWFLESLLYVYEIQNNNRLAIELAKQLADRNSSYKENLATLYTKIGQYKEALQLLDELDEEYGKTSSRDMLRTRLQAMINYDGEAQGQYMGNHDLGSTELDKMQQFFELIQQTIGTSDHVKLLSVSNEALENYPSQAEFYHAKGLALNRLKNYREAITYLTMGLDYVMDNNTLLNNIYQELVFAYQALGENTKAQEYKKKIKN